VKEFKPTLFFLLRFGLIYGLGSFVYSLFISHYDPSPDPFTIWISRQMATFMGVIGQQAELYSVPDLPYVGVEFKSVPSVSVFEGCNGLAVMILFIAFVVAFRGAQNKAALWFVPLGLLAIHLFNLVRLVLLININYHYSNLFHFYHKFVFTGVIYAFVLFLWILWVRIQQSKSKTDEV
jgi:exosortase family protein XrtF